MGFRARSVPPPGLVGTFWIKSQNVTGVLGRTVNITVTRSGSAAGQATVRVLASGVFSPARTLDFTFTDGQLGDRTLALSLLGASTGVGQLDLDPATFPSGAIRVDDPAVLTVTDWLSTPAPVFTAGTPGSYSLTPHLGSAGAGRNVNLKAGTLPASVTLDNTELAQRLIYDGTGSPTIVSGIVLESVPRP